MLVNKAVNSTRTGDISGPWGAAASQPTGCSVIPPLLVCLSPMIRSACSLGCHDHVSVPLTDPPYSCLIYIMFLRYVLFYFIFSYTRLDSIYWIVGIVLVRSPLIPQLARSFHHYPATHPPCSLLAHFSRYLVSCLPLLLSLRCRGSWPAIITLRSSLLSLVRLHLPCL
jgi:hypothetical protein